MGCWKEMNKIFPHLGLQMKFGRTSLTVAFLEQSTVFLKVGVKSNNKV